MASTSSDAGILNRPAPVLAIFWIIFGLLRLVAAVWMLGFAPTATVMFGTWLNRVPNPYPLMTWFHLAWTGWMVLSAASGVAGLLAGITLLTRAAIGRTLAIVAALLSAGFVPVGTALGAYTLALFLRRD
jgi:hypothetical protein